MARIFASYAYKGTGAKNWEFANGVYDMKRIETDLDLMGLERRIREARGISGTHLLTVLYFIELTVSPT